MFSSQDKSLLVYKDDLYSNVSEELVFYENLNKYLNEIQSLLEKFNVKIIFLVCPDKYTFYEEEIMENDKNISKIFFDYFARLDHNYYFYNSLDSLKGLNSSDLYFYDDTHWSPISAEKVAEDLNSIMFD